MLVKDFGNSKLVTSIHERGEFRNTNFVFFFLLHYCNQIQCISEAVSATSQSKKKGNIPALEKVRSPIDSKLHVFYLPP